MYDGKSASKINRITEAASALIDHVVEAVRDPASDAYNAAWAARYAAISDLNVLTAKGEDHLRATPEDPDRYPFLGFFVDDVRPDPERTRSEEFFVGNLVMRMGVNGENFATASQEIFEVFHACRSILLIDDSLGFIRKSGGVIDNIRWSGFTSPSYDEETMRVPFISIGFNFTIWFREATYR